MKPRTTSIKESLESAKAAIEQAKEKRQTAIQWLVEQVNSENYQRAFGQTYISIELVEQALFMETDQIIEAYNEGALDGLQLGEQYFNFVYKP